MKRLMAMVALAALTAVAISANAETYYSTAVPGGSAILFDASGAWTNAQGTAITVASKSTTYQNDDFVVGVGQTVAPYTSRDNTGKEFYCKTLLLEGAENAKATFVYRGSYFSRPNFVLGPYSEIYLDGRSTAGNACGIQNATFLVREDAVGEASARIVASEHMTHDQGVRILCPFSGSGSLLFTYHSTTAIKPITLWSDKNGTSTNENFTGTMKIQGADATHQLPFQVQTYTLDGLGGNPAAFEAKGLELEYARLVVFSNCTTTANRGLYISEDSEVQVTDGYALNVEGAFAFADSSKTLTKTGAGSLVLAGGIQSGAAGGTLAVNEGTLELVAAKIENGAVAAVSLDALTLGGGTAAFRITGDGSALAAGVYTVFSTTEALPAGIEGSFSVDQGALPRAMATFAVDGNAVKMTVVTENTGDPCWVGAVDGTFSNPDNWLGGAMPSAGGNVVIAASCAGTVTNDNGFSPASITFAPSCRAMTIFGDWTGISAVTNLSGTFDQTFAGHVDFGANAIDVNQIAAVPNSSPYNPIGTRVIFSGGVSGSTIKNHTVFSGNYTLSPSTRYTFPSPTSGNTKRPAIYTGSTVSVPWADVTSDVYIMDGAKLCVGVATNGWASGNHWLCAWNKGELVFTDEYVLNGNADVYLGGNASSAVSEGLNSGGIARFNRVTLLKGYGWLQPWRNTRTANISYNIYIGAGGLDFGNAAGSYYALKDAHTAVTLHPWKSDFTLHSHKNAARDLLLRGDNASPVTLTIDTTDEDGIPRKVTIDGVVETLSTGDGGAGGASGIVVKGTGTNVWNSASVNFLGTNTVTETATLLMGAGASLANGTVSVGATATFGVKESGMATVGTLKMDSGAALAFNFTQRNVAPTLAIPAASTLPATLNVKVTCDDGLSVSGLNTYTILSGCDLTGKTVNIIDPPKWVESVSVDGSGNLVLKAKSLKGFIISFH